MEEAASHHADGQCESKSAGLQPEGLDNELIDLLINGARYDDLEDVQRALSSHVDVNAADEVGRTGLSFLSSEITAICALLGFGAVTRWPFLAVIGCRQAPLLTFESLHMQHSTWLLQTGTPAWLTPFLTLER